jgi:hypothetical protein
MGFINERWTQEEVEWKLKSNFVRQYCVYVCDKEWNDSLYILVSRSYNIHSLTSQYLILNILSWVEWNDSGFNSDMKNDASSYCQISKRFHIFADETFRFDNKVESLTIWHLWRSCTSCFLLFENILYIKRLMALPL